jgi:hypothetical protein
MRSVKGHQLTNGTTQNMSSNNIGGDVSIEADYFGRNMEQYKRDNMRPYPNACEVLAVLRAMGYRKKPGGRA